VGQVHVRSALLGQVGQKAAHPLRIGQVAFLRGKFQGLGQASFGKEGHQGHPEASPIHHPALVGESQLAPQLHPEATQELTIDPLHPLPRVVVPGDGHGRNLRFCQTQEELHQEGFRLRGGLGVVHEIPADQDEVHPLGAHQSEDLLEGRGHLRGAIHAL